MSGTRKLRFADCMGFAFENAFFAHFRCGPAQRDAKAETDGSPVEEHPATRSGASSWHPWVDLQSVGPESTVDLVKMGRHCRTTLYEVCIQKFQDSHFLRPTVDSGSTL